MLERSESVSEDPRVIKHNCLFCISLQQGIQLLVILDYLAIAGMISFFTVTTYQDYSDLKPDRKGYLAFQIITEGIIIIFFFFKCYFGTQFLMYSCCLKYSNKKN